MLVVFLYASQPRDADGVEINVAVSGVSIGDANRERDGSGDDFAGLTSVTLSSGWSLSEAIQELDVHIFH